MLLEKYDIYTENTIKLLQVAKKLTFKNSWILGLSKRYQLIVVLLILKLLMHVLFNWPPTLKLIRCSNSKTFFCLIHVITSKFVRQ